MRVNIRGTVRGDTRSVTELSKYLEKIIHKYSEHYTWKPRLWSADGGAREERLQHIRGTWRILRLWQPGCQNALATKDLFFRQNVRTFCESSLFAMI